MKEVKPKKCKACKKPFTPFNSLQVVCGPSCAALLVKHAPEEANKAVRAMDRKWVKDTKSGHMTLNDWLQVLQPVFNKYIRLRDAHLPCISCGTIKQDIQYCAGHFYTRGAYPNLRVNELNVHRQCNQHCNMKLSGNIVHYRPRLIERIGEENFQLLELAKSVPWKPTIDEVKELIEHYKAKIKELSKNL